MSRLTAFWESEQNQEKYGFTYENNSIYYDGNSNELLEIAFKWAGYIRVEDNFNSDDPRPLLEMAIAENGNLVMKDTGEEIEADVDGQGMDPNFYIQFAFNGEESIIRFNMRLPELYPYNEACPFRLSMKSLSAINTFFENKYEEFAGKWKSFHPEDETDISRIPNYRAINRL